MIGKGTIIYRRELSNINEGAEIGENCKIHSNVWIGNGVKIGNRVRIQAFCFIPFGVTLEDDVFLGPHVCFTNDPELSLIGQENWLPTLVRKGAKIGAGSVIKAGIVIGESSLVGMGSTVTKDVPPCVLAYGNPCRVIRYLSPKPR